MKENRFRRVIAEGRIPVGHMIWEFGTRGIAKILESADLDFVLIDMEHSEFDTERVADLIAWFKATPIAPFVRVPQCLYHFLARVMDAGALGVMVGNVETREQAELIVRSVKYPPLGKRGVGLGCAHTDYVGPDPATYFRTANESSVIICQIESPIGLANLDAIASTEGVDVLWVGHMDLSTAMGIPADFQNPAFLDALAAVVAAARRYGKLAGIQPGSAEQADQWMGIGYNVISWKADTALFTTALRSEVAELRRAFATAVRDAHAST
jgi:2-dehydro-3-deoxyglucarate aldolase/4-hydroxy-2-oxoheptanedioate aldolase